MPTVNPTVNIYLTPPRRAKTAHVSFAFAHAFQITWIVMHKENG